MSGLADAIRAAQKQVDESTPLVITALRYAWLDRPEHERYWNDRAIEHMVKVKRGEFARPRHGRFSPSGLGGCPRRQMFSFMGLPQEMNDGAEMEEIAEGGKAAHLDWQGDGFTQPYLLDAEVWVYEPSLLTGGSLDGLALDSSIFELKTVTGINFDKVVNTDVRLSWRLQLAIYFLLADSAGIHHHDLASLVVTSRDFGQFREIRWKRSSADERLALGILYDLNRHLEEGTLPKMLEDCVYKSGTTYKRCPYAQVCPRVETSTIRMDGRTPLELVDFS